MGFHRILFRSPTDPGRASPTRRGMGWSVCVLGVQRLSWAPWLCGAWCWLEKKMSLTFRFVISGDDIYLCFMAEEYSIVCDGKSRHSFNYPWTFELLPSNAGSCEERYKAHKCVSGSFRSSVNIFQSVPRSTIAASSIYTLQHANHAPSSWSKLLFYFSLCCYSCN